MPEAGRNYDVLFEEGDEALEDFVWDHPNDPVPEQQATPASQRLLREPLL